MFQQQGLGLRTFHTSRVGTAALAFAVAGAVAIGAIVVVSFAASRQGTPATAAVGPIAIAHPVLNTGDSIDLQNAVQAASKPRLNTGDSIDLENAFAPAKLRLNTGDSVDLQNATQAAAKNAYEAVRPGMNTGDTTGLQNAIDAATPVKEPYIPGLNH
jgi:hypothetical protein